MPRVIVLASALASYAEPDVHVIHDRSSPIGHHRGYDAGIGLEVAPVLDGYDACRAVGVLHDPLVAVLAGYVLDAVDVASQGRDAVGDEAADACSLTNAPDLSPEVLPTLAAIISGMLRSLLLT